MSGIVDPAMRGNESGDDLLFGICGDSHFQELFSEFIGCSENSSCNVLW